METSDLLDLASAYWKSACLNAAVELELFAPLESGSAELEQICRDLGTSPKYTRALLDALVGLGLLEKQSQQYAMPEALKNTLSSSHPDSLLGAIRFNRALYPMWGRLADCVRKGEPAIPPDAQLGSDPARVRGFVQGMHSRARVLGPAIVSEIDLDGRRRLLDVAAGPGTFSAMMLKHWPELELTLFDLPAVSQISRDLHAGSPEGNRITFTAGDYHKDPLPEGPFDAVFYAGAVHQEDLEHTRVILEKIRAVLEPGGSFFLLDLMLDDDRTQPVFSALFEINMMLSNSMSHVHTVSGIRALIEEAGFEGILSREIPGTPYHLLECRKSSGAERPSQRPLEGENPPEPQATSCESQATDIKEALRKADALRADNHPESEDWDARNFEAKLLYEEALTTLPRPLQLSDAGLLNNLGAVYLDLGEIDLAREQLEAARELEPRSAATLYNLAVAYMKNGDPEAQARDCFTLAEKLPRRPGTHCAFFDPPLD